MSRNDIVRQLPVRTTLPQVTLSRLQKETDAIIAADDPKQKAEIRYENARKTKWFKPILDALCGIVGLGGRCMLCSGSESSQVEHFYPKTVFPKYAMTWENFLWACGICNQRKGDHFPLDANDEPVLINPLDENVWKFFFIDEYGNLTPCWRNDLDDFDPRAAKTREIYGLDRQALQESRQKRLNDLKKRIEDSICLFQSGKIDKNALQDRLEEWLEQPFQPDVADYFLNGPGASESPFADYFSLLT